MGKLSGLDGGEGHRAVSSTGYLSEISLPMDSCDNQFIKLMYHLVITSIRKMTGKRRKRDFLMTPNVI